MCKRPLLAMGLLAFAAALVYDRLSLVWITVIGIASLSVLVGALMFRRKPVAKPCGFGAAGVLLVSIALILHACLVMYPSMAYDGETAQVTLRVISRATDSVYLTQTEEGDVKRGVRMTLHYDNDNIGVRAGDLIVGTVNLEKSTNSYAKVNNAFLFAEAERVVWKDGTGSLSTSKKILYSLRETIHDIWYRYMDFDSAALCDAITIGNRYNLSADLRYEFRTSGIYHILCVSGLHLSVLSGVLFWVLKKCRVRERYAALLIMAVVLLFAVVCGLTGSVTRSMLMTMVMLASCLTRRNADGLNSLGLAVVLIMAFDPMAIADLGFLLSVSATFGILSAFPVWDKEITARLVSRFPRGAVVCELVSSMLGVTVCATLLAQPLISLYYGNFSVYFVLGNILCLYPSMALLILCFAAVMCQALAPLAVENVCILCKYLCHYLMDCAHAITSWPFATISVSTPFALFVQFLLPVLLMLGYRYRRMTGMALALSAILLVSTLSCVLQMVWTHDTLEIIPLPADNLSLAVKTADSNGLIFEGDGDALRASMEAVCAEGINRFEWVLWLNEASIQSIDLSSFVIPIDHLMVLHEPSRYGALPSAARTTVLGDACTISFCEGGTIERHDKWFSLVFGETYVLIADDYADAKTLSAAQRKADMVVLDEYIPYHAELLTTERAVVFCKSYWCAYWREHFPKSIDDVQYVCEESAIYIARGNGDIYLRAY